MKKYSMPMRQIHLDFHTSKYIEGVGKNFNAEVFVNTLKKARVNSINLFTKCHHGMFYYPTKIGTVHPYLKEGLDLFGEQLRVCRENNIRAIAYTCVAWNEDWADRHPEWLVVDYNGVLGNLAPFANHYTRWHSLCINNPDYKALLKEEFREVYDLYQVQGFWVDIILGRTCICPHCKADMERLGLDPKCFDDVKRHDRLIEIRFCKEFAEFFKTLGEDVEYYFNSHPYELDNAADMEISSAEKRKYFSFIDIESLPSEEWGYAHFPVAVNYAAGRGIDVTMMNGKFHTSWGDFGTLRNIPALEYECFRALANGTGVCIGDQLHPFGELDSVVYERIGNVFRSIEEKEPWVQSTEKCVEVGVIIPSSPLASDNPNHGSLVEESIYRVLSELHIPFDFLNFLDSLTKYKLIILPDNVRPTAELAAKLDAYVKNGGKILATGNSGRGKEGFLMDEIPCEYEGESEYDVRYIRLADQMFGSLPNIDHALYVKGAKVHAKPSAKVLADYVYPFFNRAYDKFCSHRQTPPTLENSGEPAIVESGGCIYCSAPLFTDYILNSYRICRDVLEACITKLYDKPLIVTDLPGIVETTLRKNQGAYILHLVGYVIERKNKRLETVENRYPVFDRHISVRTETAPSSVKIVPGGKDAPFAFKDGYTTIDIQFAEGHTMFEILK